MPSGRNTPFGRPAYEVPKSVTTLGADQAPAPARAYWKMPVAFWSGGLSRISAASARTEPSGPASSAGSPSTGSMTSAAPSRPAASTGTLSIR